MQGVLSVLLATFTGFGVTMCANSILVEVLKWRREWRARSNQQQGSVEATEIDQPATIPQQMQTNNPNHDENHQGGDSNAIRGN